MPATVGACVSSRLATLVELDTVLSVADLHLLLEVDTVDAYNRSVANANRD